MTNSSKFAGWPVEHADTITNDLLNPGIWYLYLQYPFKLSCDNKHISFFHFSVVTIILGLNNGDFQSLIDDLPSRVFWMMIAFLVFHYAMWLLFEIQRCLTESQGIVVCICCHVTRVIHLVNMLVLPSRKFCQLIFLPICSARVPSVPIRKLSVLEVSVDEELTANCLVKIKWNLGSWSWLWCY